MAIRTRLRTRFFWTQVLTIGICLLLGLWGVWDYVVEIPRRERNYEIFEAAGNIAPAFEVEADRETINEAQEEVTEALDAVLDRVAADAGLETTFTSSDASWFIKFTVLAGDEVMGEAPNADTVSDADRELVAALKASKDWSWFRDLLVVRFALAARQPGAPLRPEAVQAYESLQAWQTRLQDARPPAAYDRPLQWAYMLCLPFVPWLAWGFWKASRDRRTLEDNGDLVTPDRRIPAASIAGIDMSRWMSKSIAVVKTTGGEEVILDDYKQQDMDKIVGALAHQHHPEAWTAEAKPVKTAPEGADDPTEPTDDPAEPRTDAPEA